MRKKLILVFLSLLVLPLFTASIVWAGEPSRLGPAGKIPEETPQTLWSDTFDSYATGSMLHGQGGWKGWDNNPTFNALVTDTIALSQPNSVESAGTTDVLHEFAGMTTGKWTFTGRQYIPDGFTGDSYFILLNTYSDGGIKNWSTQVVFSRASAMISNTGVSGGSLPLIANQWVEIRVEIDLDSDKQDFFYNNQLLYSGSWTHEVSGSGASEIAAVSLFANGSSAVYYDNFQLFPFDATRLFLPVIARNASP